MIVEDIAGSVTAQRIEQHGYNELGREKLEEEQPEK
jgi:hypothetical protein